MTANDSKFYLSYLNELVDQCNNTFHYSINEKLLMLLILLWLEKLRWILSLLNLMIESELLSVRIFLLKITLKIGQEKYLLLILFLKLILWLIKLKI